MSKLTVENVERIFVDCLTNEDNPNAIECNPVIHKCVFDAQKINEHKDEIKECLMALPKEFRENEGGGYSFLAACNDIDGNQWTGLHLNMEKLFALGTAAGYITSLVPRNMWFMLPGNMPYFMIKEDAA